MKVRDHQGNDLVPQVLRIIQRDTDRAPVVLRVCDDDEKIDLSDPATPNDFLIVWATARMAESETNVVHLFAGLQEMKELLETSRDEITIARREVAAANEAHRRLSAENEQKTAALRELQKERDPERLQQAIAQAREIAIADREHEVATLRACIADMRSKIDELTASKRKLREALERQKVKG